MKRNKLIIFLSLLFLSGCVDNSSTELDTIDLDSPIVLAGDSLETASFIAKKFSLEIPEPIDEAYSFDFTDDKIIPVKEWNYENGINLLADPETNEVLSIGMFDVTIDELIDFLESEQIPTATINTVQEGVEREIENETEFGPSEFEHNEYNYKVFVVPARVNLYNKPIITLEVTPIR